MKTQAGAELCQAQAQVILPVEAEFILEVEKVICAHAWLFSAI